MKKKGKDSKQTEESIFLYTTCLETTGMLCCGMLQMVKADLDSGRDSEN